MGTKISKIKMNRSSDLADRAATTVLPPCHVSIIQKALFITKLKSSSVIGPS